MRISCSLLCRVSALLLSLSFLLPFEVWIPDPHISEALRLSLDWQMHSIYGFELISGNILLFISGLLFVTNFLSDSQRVKQLRIILSAVVLIGISFIYLLINMEVSSYFQVVLGSGFFALCTMGLINMLVQLSCRIQ